MMTTDRGIFLGRVRIGDNSDILKIFMRDGGLTSFIVRGSRASNKRLTAFFRPLARLECVFDFREARELQYLKSCGPDADDDTLHSHPVRASVAAFVAELLAKTLESGYQNRALFDFLSQEIELLATEEKFQNRHLSVLLGLAIALGIEPDTRGDLPAFHLGDGHRCREDEQGLYVLKGREAQRFISFAEGRMPAQHSDRSALTDDVLLYFRLHIEHMKPLKSPEVLRAVLG